MTREKLLISARTVVAREGYESASVDKIAEEAGFSKGAFYSNFNSKEDIVLELLEMHSREDVAEITQLLGESREPEHMIEVISQWAHDRSTDPTWGLLTMELFRRARRDETFGERHSNLFRKQWIGLGDILLNLFPAKQPPADPETLGRVVLELAYGASSTLNAGPPPGDMVKLVLSSLYRAFGTQTSNAPSTALDASAASHGSRRRKQSD